MSETLTWSGPWSTGSPSVAPPVWRAETARLCGSAAPGSAYRSERPPRSQTPAGAQWTSCKPYWENTPANGAPNISHAWQPTPLNQAMTETHKAPFPYSIGRYQFGMLCFLRWR